MGVCCDSALNNEIENSKKVAKIINRDTFTKVSVIIYIKIRKLDLEPLAMYT